MRQVPPVAAMTLMAAIMTGYIRALKLDMGTSGVVNGRPP
jgi:hypothetical protein